MLVGAHAGFTGIGIGRHEDVAHPVLAFLGQIDLFFSHHLAQELVGDLHEDTRTITGVRIGAAGTPVIHVFVHCQGLDDYVVGALALEMSDEADAAGVFFARGIPESLSLWPADG